jgi:hypothetical protein
VTRGQPRGRLLRTPGPAALYWPAGDSRHSTQPRAHHRRAPRLQRRGQYREPPATDLRDAGRRPDGVFRDCGGRRQFRPLSNHIIGEAGGAQTVTPLTSEVPQHNHTCSAGPGGRSNVQYAVPPHPRVQSVRRVVECQDRERTNPWRGSPDSTVPSPIEGVAPVSVAVKAEPATLAS